MSNEERLEEIKYNHTISHQGVFKSATVDLEELKWLIQRAEHAQYLERKYENTGSMFGRQAQRTLIDENKRLREALGFYANSKNYEVNVVDQWGPEIKVMVDGGDKAQQTLEENQ